MTNALLDQNFVHSKLAVLNTDGVTIVRIKCNESNGAMKVNTTDTISFTMTPIINRDDNRTTCMTWVGTDGLVYPWVANSSGEVLINSN